MKSCHFLLVYIFLLSGAPFFGPTPFFVFGDGDHARGGDHDHGHGRVTTAHTTVPNGESPTISSGISSSGPSGLGAGEISSTLSSVSPDLVSSLSQNPAVSSYLRNSGSDLGLVTASKAEAEAGGSTSTPIEGSGGDGGEAYNYPTTPVGLGGVRGGFDSSLLFSPKYKTDVRFFLFNDCLNPENSIEVFQNKTSVTDKIHRVETKVVIHGFLNTKNSIMPTTIKNAFLTTGNKQNVIVVDWRNLSFGYLSSILTRDYNLYRKSVESLYNVATATYKFLKFLIKENFIDCDSIKIVGHSLGARITAEIARQFFTDNDTCSCKLNEIVLIDPAGPLFDGISKASLEIPKIRNETASCVLIIYSDRKYFGTKNLTQGTANVIINGGFSHGCSFWNVACSHTVGYLFYAMTIMQDNKTCSKMRETNCLQGIGDETTCNLIPSKQNGSRTIYVEFDIDADVNDAIKKNQCTGIPPSGSQTSEMSDERLAELEGSCPSEERFFKWK